MPLPPAHCYFSPVQGADCVVGLLEQMLQLPASFADQKFAARHNASLSKMLQSSPTEVSDLSAAYGETLHVTGSWWLQDTGMLPGTRHMAAGLLLANLTLW